MPKVIIAGVVSIGVTLITLVSCMDPGDTYTVVDKSELKTISEYGDTVINTEYEIVVSSPKGGFKSFIIDKDSYDSIFIGDKIKEEI